MNISHKLSRIRVLAVPCRCLARDEFPSGKIWPRRRRNAKRRDVGGGVGRPGGMVPVRTARLSAVVAQPCRRRGVGQLNCRAVRGCSTVRVQRRRRETPGAVVHAPTYTRTPCARGGWWCLPHSRVHPVTVVWPLFFYVPQPCLSLTPFPLLSSVLQPLAGPSDKGASATLRAGSGRLASRIGRLFETASRVDIALVTNEKVGSSNVDASTWLRLRQSGLPWGKEDFSRFGSSRGCSARSSDAKQP